MITGVRPGGHAQGPVVALDQLSFGFEGSLLLDNLSLQIWQGELVTILGISGTGKTTLLKLISGLIRPQQGRVQLRTRRIGVVFQDQRLLPWRTAGENVALGCLAQVEDGGKRQQRAVQLLQRCGFPPQAIGRYPNQLSGGMGARVALARALAVDPELLLMDEPFSGLDMSLRSSMQDLVRDLVETEGITGLLVTHDIMEAIRLGDRILILARKQLISRPGLPLPYAQRDPKTLHQAVAELLRDPVICKALAL